MPARNEANFLPRTLEALAKQTRKLDSFVLVDDGSTDNTARIAFELAGNVASRSSVLVLSDVPHPHLNTGRIAEVVNAGIDHSLALLQPRRPDYFFMIGADDVLDREYVGYLCHRMEEDPMLVIASGAIDGLNLCLETPIGVSLIRASWWRPPRYRPEYGEGAETYLILRAWYDGYRTRLFPQVVDHPQRSVGTRADWHGRGQACRQLGYTWVEILDRTLSISFAQRYGIRKGMKFLRGYLAGPEPSEDWLGSVHRRILRRKMTERFGSMGSRFWPRCRSG